MADILYYYVQIQLKKHLQREKLGESITACMQFVYTMSFTCTFFEHLKKVYIWFGDCPGQIKVLCSIPYNILHDMTYRVQFVSFSPVRAVCAWFVQQCVVDDFS